MERARASDFDPGLLDLFDRYVHGAIDRRGFLEGAARFATGVVTPVMLLDALRPRFAEAQQVAPDDRRLEATYLVYPSPRGHAATRGYLVRPAGTAGRLPGVLVAHENRGLNPHIEDIARRLALDGFMTLAPDALAPLGGYPGDEDRARELFARLDQARTREDFVAAVAFLRSRSDATGRVGVVGFCYGGTIANVLATRVAELGAAVSFYGGQPPAGEVRTIRAPLLLHYAGNDERVNAGWPDYEAALKAHDVPYTVHVYPGTQHGFHNDTTPRYDQAAAALAWQRTVAFLKRHLD